MRHYLKSLVIAAATLYIAQMAVPTIDIGTSIKNYALVVGAIFLIVQIINPIFSLVLLPINHLTFGLVMFTINIALFFGLINFLPGFTVGAFDFPGATVNGVILPAVNFNQTSTVILVAFVIALVQKILHIIFE